ncbi:MAG TPA: hypothetical protein VMD02_07520 [Candidatus Omnitrophota bacterium]|nr:hypothetical protein [Candidatus Omnitrophota bacterium]
MFRSTTSRYGRAEVALVKACVTQQLDAFSYAPPGFRVMGRLPMLTGVHPQLGWQNVTIYKEEKKKSSDVFLFNGHVHWSGRPHLEQMFLKLKDRTEIRLLWEYVMLSTWDRLLNAHSQGTRQLIGAPTPIKVEKNRGETGYYTLLMTFCPGMIVQRVNQHSRDIAIAHSGDETVPVFLSIAYYLGRLAAIKEIEELIHGDYALRHLIYDPKPTTVASITLKNAGGRFEWVPQPSTPFSNPKLWMIDVENSAQAPRSQVAIENDRLFSDFRKIVQGKQNLRYLDRYYRDGYDSADPSPRLEGIKREQLETLGVNMDVLF